MQKTLNSIKFPVYPIPKQGTIKSEEYRLVYYTKSGNPYIVDDVSLPGTFPIRRVALQSMEDLKILPLKKAVLTLGSLVVFARIYTYFIDSTGRLFTYKRQTLVPVITKKVERHFPYKNATVLVLENCHCPIILYRPIKLEEEYAIVALVEKGYILLGMSRTPYLRKSKIKI